MKSFDRLVLIIIAGLLVVLAGVILIGNQAGIRAPTASPAEGELVSIRGPLGLTFQNTMQAASVEEHVKIVPELDGRFQWDERTVWFWPSRPLRAGQVYTLRLEAGAKSEDGREIRRAVEYRYQVRQPTVVFMSPVTGMAELWSSSYQQPAVTPLTQTGGGVYDFGVSPDGQRIVYSLRNEQDGLDLWVMDRSGENQQLLLGCGPDWCSNPALSPDGQQVAYARRNASLQPGGPPGVPRIWTLTMATGQTAVLYNDEEITGFEPSWSPSGSRLAFFDGTSGGIRVLAVEGEDEVLLPSNMGAVGAWSPDGKQMMFIDMETAGDRPYVIVYLADFETQSITPALSSDQGQAEYGRPVWSPDGEWVAVSQRPLSGAGTPQIWVMRPDGSDALAVTEAFNYAHTAYRWSPGGDALVFQRLALSSSNTKPEVVVWQRDSGEFTVLGEDAGFADWLP